MSPNVTSLPNVVVIIHDSLSRAMFHDRLHETRSVTGCSFASGGSKWQKVVWHVLFDAHEPHHVQRTVSRWLRDLRQRKSGPSEVIEFAQHHALDGYTHRNVRLVCGRAAGVCRRLFLSPVSDKGPVPRIATAAPQTITSLR